MRLVVPPHDIAHTAAGPAPLSCVLVLTGDSTEETRTAALEAGATDYVVKPCRPDQLVARIRHVLAGRTAASAPDRL